MPAKKLTPKQRQMQDIIDKLVPVVGALEETLLDMQKLPRFPAHTRHVAYAHRFVTLAIVTTDDAVNAMVAQLGEKNLR